jgi:MFS family permease
MLAAAVGVFFGGLLTQDFGWRWVFFVNLTVCALVLSGAFRILKADHGRSVPGGFDVVGAVLVTASMLLLIFTLVKAPDEGWGAGRGRCHPGDRLGRVLLDVLLRHFVYAERPGLLPAADRALVAAGAIALRASNTRGEPAATPQTQQNLEPSYDPA